MKKLLLEILDAFQDASAGSGIHREKLANARKKVLALPDETAKSKKPAA